MIYDFDYEPLTDKKGHPVFLVRLKESGLPPHILGVVRRMTKSRFSNPLTWTAVVTTEPDPEDWPKKAHRGTFDERDHAAIWLMGMQDSQSVGFREAAKALHAASIEEMLAPDRCPACGKSVISNYNTHRQIKNGCIPGRLRDELDCQNCQTPVFRERGDLPHFKRHPWQLVSPEPVSEPEKVHEEFGRQQLDDRYFEPPYDDQP
jgi:hypothetical protein